MLAEMGSLRGAASITVDQGKDGRTDDLRGMLAELDRLASSPLATASALENDDPRRMLAELTMLSASDLRSVSSPSNDDYETTDDDDIVMLRNGLQNLRSNHGRSPGVAPDHVKPDGTSCSKAQNETVVRPAPQLDPEVIPYIIALELEQSGIQWEHARAWTTILYSSGLNSREAQQDKEAAVSHAEDALKTIIRSVMELEEKFRRKDEDSKLQRRLVVSNLAADADEEALGRQFWKHRYQM